MARPNSFLARGSLTKRAMAFERTGRSMPYCALIIAKSAPIKPWLLAIDFIAFGVAEDGSTVRLPGSQTTMKSTGLEWSSPSCRPAIASQGILASQPCWPIVRCPIVETDPVRKPLTSHGSFRSIFEDKLHWDVSDPVLSRGISVLPKSHFLVGSFSVGR